MTKKALICIEYSKQSQVKIYQRQKGISKSRIFPIELYHAVYN